MTIFITGAKLINVPAGDKDETILTDLLVSFISNGSSSEEHFHIFEGETAKGLLSEFSQLFRSRVIDIVNSIIEFGGLNGKISIDLLRTNLELINSKLAPVVFRDVLELFEINKILTHDQAKIAIDEYFIIEPVQSS